MAGIKAGGAEDGRGRGTAYTNSTNFLSTSLPIGGKVSPVYRHEEDNTNGDDEDNDMGMRSIFAKLLSLKVAYSFLFKYFVALFIRKQIL